MAGPEAGPTLTNHESLAYRLYDVGLEVTDFQKMDLGVKQCAV